MEGRVQDSCDLGLGKVAGEHGNEPWGSIKCLAE